MSQHQKYFRQRYPGPEGLEDDPLRMFIRRNRKKILIFLGMGVVLVFAIIVVVGIFLFTTVIPAGTEAINQSVGSGQAQSVFIGVKNWVAQFMESINPMQLLNLFLQAN